MKNQTIELLKALTTLTGVRQGIAMVRSGQEELAEATRVGNKEGIEAARKKIAKGEQVAEYFGDKPETGK